MIMISVKVEVKRRAPFVKLGACAFLVLCVVSAAAGGKTS